MSVRPVVVSVIVACVFSAAAVAHPTGGVEAARTAQLASRPEVTISGYIDEIVVENRVSGIERRHAVLIGDDGVRYLVSRGADVSLTTGAAYLVVGWVSGKILYAQSARLTANPDTRRSAAAAKPAITIDGRLRLGHADNFDGTPSEFFYAIVGEGEQRRIALGSVLEGLENAAPASVTGRIGEDGQLFADRIVILGPPEPKPKADAAVQAAPVTTTYLVMPIKFPTNGSAPFTYGADPFSPASLATAVFGASPAKSVGEYYNEVSYGKQLLSGVVADNGAGGFLLANVPKPANCDISAIAKATEDAATARGYNLGSYAGRLYVFSNVSGCAWSGLAYVGWARAYSNNSSNLLVIAHELGHNFGLLHAASLNCGANVIDGGCSSAEYGDPFDVMGNNRAMHFASAQKDMLGWLPAGTVALHKAGVASYALAPIETASGTKYAIKIPAGPLRTYWIEYRQPIGFDAGLSTFPNNGAQIRIQSPFETICSGCSDDTEFLDMTPATSGTFTDGTLVVGKNFVDSTKGITISTIAQGGGTLTVSVAAPTRPSFADVPATHPNYADIETIYWYGITKGCAGSPLLFCPAGTVSRAEMAVFIERSKRGESFVGSATGTKFADVPAGYWAGGQIEQLYADGITGGCASAPLRFCPDNKVTRAEMAIFMLRARNGSGYNPGAAKGTVFADVPATYWAAAWIERAYQLNMMPGCASAPLRFCPDSLVPRAEMATLLAKTFSLIPAPL